MLTLTQVMIARVETLKAAYADLIAENARYDQDSTIEFHGWKRMNAILSYLADRMAR